MSKQCTNVLALTSQSGVIKKKIKTLKNRLLKEAGPVEYWRRRVAYCSD